MNIYKKGIISKIFLGIAICLMCSGYTFSYLACNGSGLIYSEQETGAESDIRNSVIDSFVEQGAGYLFDAYSDYMDFSKSFELQNQKGIDFTEWQTHVYSALINIRKAKTTYSLLIKEAEVTPYNWRVVYKLWFFDYYEFRRNKGLNAVIFGEVESYLAFGDVTGLYKKVYNDLAELERLLNKIMGDLYAKEKPALEDLWDLNDTFAHTVTFGQYVARVFYAI